MSGPGAAVAHQLAAAGGCGGSWPGLSAASLTHAGGLRHRVTLPAPPLAGGRRQGRSDRPTGRCRVRGERCCQRPSKRPPSTANWRVSQSLRSGAHLGVRAPWGNLFVKVSASLAASAELGGDETGSALRALILTGARQIPRSSQCACTVACSAFTLSNLATKTGAVGIEAANGGDRGLGGVPPHSARHLAVRPQHSLCQMSCGSAAGAHSCKNTHRALGCDAKPAWLLCSWHCGGWRKRPSPHGWLMEGLPRLPNTCTFKRVWASGSRQRS